MLFAKPFTISFSSGTVYVQLLSGILGAAALVAPQFYSTKCQLFCVCFHNSICWLLKLKYLPTVKRRGSMRN